MNAIIKFFGIGILLLAAASCAHKPTAGESIQLAREAIVDGQYEQAVANLDDAFAALSDSLASPTQLSEVAMLYMMLNDHIEDADCSLKAMDAYRKAMRIDPDSVNIYVLGLDPGSMQYMFVIQTLSNAIDAASNGILPSDFEEGDLEVIEDENVEPAK